MSVTEFARQIVEMDEELHYLRRECASLKEHNAELLRHIVDSNRASEAQLHGWIAGLIDGTLPQVARAP